VARKAGFAFTGAYDVVRVLAALALAGALPVTTAAKGHVAIEYFFGKLGPRSRLAVDSVMRALMVAALGCAAWSLVLRGEKSRVATSIMLNGKMAHVPEVTSTLKMPFFWVYWVLAASCALTALVVVFHLLKPGKEMVEA
jgi:TRAP-type C4-dicarboxylate transport system permease small subunit